MVFLAENFDKELDVSDDFNLVTWPFYWLVGTSELYIEGLKSELSQGKLDVTIWRVLMILPNHESLALGVLAKLTVTKRSTISRMLCRMEEQGYILVSHKENDKRVKYVRLTNKGRVEKKKAKRHADNIAKLALGNIPHTEITSLMKTLSKLQKNLLVSQG